MRYLIMALIGFNLLVLGNNVSASESSYKIIFKLPQQWQLENDAQDAGGYTQRYVSANDETIEINYGKGITSSLKDSMQEVLNVMASTDCQNKGSKVITQQKNVLVFTTFVDQCPNGKTLKQVFKVFNMPDGQYSILYTADVNMISPKIIQKMGAIIEAAKIAANN